MVKRFLQLRTGRAGQANRHAPGLPPDRPQFAPERRKPIVAGAAELARNPRARSAKLRLATRSDAPPAPLDPALLGMPQLELALR